MQQSTTQERKKLRVMIQNNDFRKIDLRVAKIIKAQNVEGANKLLQLILDIGEQETRNVFAGIKAHYTTKGLEGRLTTLWLQTYSSRKMRFGHLTRDGTCSR